MDGFRLHDSCARLEKRLACLTTPAPNADGRPPPKKSIEAGAKSRWLNDSRQFAPWHYQEEAMVEKEGQLHIPPADLKDQLQGLPGGFTRVDNMSEKSRHRLFVGNAWHFQVSRMLLVLLLQACVSAASSLPRSPPINALQFTINLSKAELHGMGPLPARLSPSTHRIATGLWDHWQMVHEDIRCINHPRSKLELNNPFARLHLCWETSPGSVKR